MKYNLSDDEIMGGEKTFLKLRKNGLMLSDKDVEILDKHGINYLDFKSLSELIFAIENLLDDDYELEELNIRLGEYNYYHYTNK